MVICEQRTPKLKGRNSALALGVGSADLAGSATGPRTELRLVYWPFHRLERSLDHEQKERRALTTALPHTNGAIHFLFNLANLDLDGGSLVEPNEDVDEVIG